MKKGEEQHYFKCDTCGKDVDMRNLSEVFEHEHDDSLPKINGDDYTAIKVGEAIEWSQGKAINLN